MGILPLLVIVSYYSWVPGIIEVGGTEEKRVAMLERALVGESGNLFSSTSSATKFLRDFRKSISISKHQYPYL